MNHISLWFSKSYLRASFLNRFHQECRWYHCRSARIHNETVKVRHIGHQCFAITRNYQMHCLPVSILVAKPGRAQKQTLRLAFASGLEHNQKKHTRVITQLHCLAIKQLNVLMEIDVCFQIPFYFESQLSREPHFT